MGVLSEAEFGGVGVSGNCAEGVGNGIFVSDLIVSGSVSEYGVFSVGRGIRLFRLLKLAGVWAVEEVKKSVLLKCIFWE